MVSRGPYSRKQVYWLLTRTMSRVLDTPKLKLSPNTIPDPRDRRIFRSTVCYQQRMAEKLGIDLSNIKYHPIIRHYELGLRGKVPCYSILLELEWDILKRIHYIRVLVLCTLLCNAACGFTKQRPTCAECNVRNELQRKSHWPCHTHHKYVLMQWSEIRGATITPSLRSSLLNAMGCSDMVISSRAHSWCDVRAICETARVPSAMHDVMLKGAHL